MRNALISIILFICVMIFVLFFNMSLIKLCDNIEFQSEKIEVTLTKGNFQDAYVQSIELLNLIQNNNFLTSIYVSHQDFDSLNDEAVKLSIYTTYRDYSQAHASLHSVKCSAQHIKKLQVPSLENIL